MSVFMLQQYIEHFSADHSSGYTGYYGLCVCVFNVGILCINA